MEPSQKDLREMKFGCVPLGNSAPLNGALPIPVIPSGFHLTASGIVDDDHENSMADQSEAHPLKASLQWKDIPELGHEKHGLQVALVRDIVRFRFLIEPLAASEDAWFAKSWSANLGAIASIDLAARNRSFEHYPGKELPVLAFLQFCQVNDHLYFLGLTVSSDPLTHACCSCDSHNLDSFVAGLKQAGQEDLEGETETAMAADEQNDLVGVPGLEVDQEMYAVDCIVETWLLIRLNRMFLVPRCPVC
ncbi:hypothetical protein HAX54_008011 [Datura stramonium]|uniref:Uncharacterized protein n=1 Tax=Datura stramonium TaxID=4076 RepID=A0ABS8WX20_DATST|nr:hypothetical protein [Datura stramonium]